MLEQWRHDMWKHEPDPGLQEPRRGFEDQPTRDFLGVQWLGPWAPEVGGARV